MGLPGDEVAQAAQRSKIFCHQLFVFHPNAAVALHEGDQSNQSERVDLQWFIRITDRRLRGSVFVDGVFEFLWYFHF